MAKAFSNWVVGDHDYRGSEVDGQRYAVVYSEDRIARIRRIETEGNPVVWQDGDPQTEFFNRVVANQEETPAAAPAA